MSLIFCFTPKKLNLKLRPTYVWRGFWYFHTFNLMDLGAGNAYSWGLNDDASGNLDLWVSYDFGPLP